MANIKLFADRTEVMRVDPDFKKEMQKLSRFKSNQEGCDIKPPRITKALFNQLMKYPELIKEIKFKPLGLKEK